MKQHIDTKLGVAMILIIAITVGAFVWQWEKKNPIDQSENNSVMHIKNNPVKDQSIAETQVNQEADLKNYPPMDSKEVARLTELTKDWKTYESEDGSYEFKYPANYSIEKDKFEKGSHEVDIINKSGCIFKDEGSQTPCTIVMRTLQQNDQRIKSTEESKDVNLTKFSINGNNIVYIPSDRVGAIVRMNTGIYQMITDPNIDSVNVFQGVYFTLKEIN